MKGYSIWNDFDRDVKFNKLDRDITTDVLIIGGGITGISMLYHLRDSSFKVVLVDQNRVGRSTTGNSTGKLSYLQNDLISKIRKIFGDDKASMYLDMQRESIDDMVNIIKDNNIDCDLEQSDSYIYTDKDDSTDKVKDMEDFLKGNGINIYHDKVDFVDYKYSFNVKDTYLINPIRFIYGIIGNRNDEIYENSGIKKVEKDGDNYICYGDGFNIRCKYVVWASHYPYFLKPMMFPVRCSIEKSYISASLGKINPISLISYSYPFVSIRNYRDYFIYLSNSNTLSKDMDVKERFSKVIDEVNKLGYKPSYLWSNSDILTNDGLPYIGVMKDNMLIGTGYNTWGLSNGFMAGKILSDIIMGCDNKYIELFDPNRINMEQVVGVLGDTMDSINGYVKGYFNSGDSVHKCPHMGCPLIYNEVENTWDCPCHGSRFSKNGKCICSPSNSDINI